MKPVKSEDGVAYPADDFAYVPDPAKPSTWKLRLTDRPGHVTVAMLGAASSAFSPGGHRGQKVILPAADVAGVKARIRAEYSKLKVKPADVPASVKEAEVAAPGLPSATEPADPLTFEGEQKRGKAEEVASKLSELSWVLNRVIRNILRAEMKSSDKQGLIAKACADFQTSVGAELPADIAAAAEVVREVMEDAMRAIGTSPRPSPQVEKGNGERHRGQGTAPTTATTSPQPSPQVERGNGGVGDGKRAHGKLERITEWFPAASVDPLGEGDYRVVFLATGWTKDGKRYYPRETLAKASEAGIFSGAKMFLNHSDPRADASRGHRNIEDWAATLKPGSVRMTESGMEAVAHAHKAAAREILDDPVAKAAVGLSHDSTVRLRQKQIDGKQAQVVESIETCHSVDFVPSGNAHGRVIEAAHDGEELSDMDADEIMQAVTQVSGAVATLTAKVDALATSEAGASPAAPGTEGGTAGAMNGAPTPAAGGVTEAQITEIATKVISPREAALQARVKELEDDKARALVMGQVTQLVEAREDLSPAARARVIEGFQGQIIATDQIATQVTEACDREREYALQVLQEAGVRTRVTGLGSAPPEQAQKTREAYEAELREKLAAEGYDAAEIERLVKAR